MPTIDYHASLRCLVAVRGHPFDRTAFDAMFQGMPGISATMVDQPAAAQLMNPAAMRDYDALVLYDMPGLDFSGIDGPLAVVEPSDAFKAEFRALLAEGKGVVALHHALAGWPTWDEYGDWLGGRFLYRPQILRGALCVDSGYRHDVKYRAELASDHPVTAGLPQSFAMQDELYLAEVFGDEVTPLLRSSASFTRDHFWSADRAINGHMFDNEGWDHAPGSKLIGWAKMALASRLVYLQPGDGASTYENPHYRRLVENALRWVVRKDQ